MRQLILMAFLTTLLSCGHQTKFTHTVEKIDIQSYMGKWYVQAGRFTPFEKDVTNSVEIYTWNEKKERIDIDFSYNKGSFDGKKVEMPQNARIYNKKTNAHWKVSPIWFLQFDFLIIAHAPDNSWTVIGVPDQSYLWIMTREAHPKPGLVDEIIQQVAALNYDVSNMVRVPHQK